MGLVTKSIHSTKYIPLTAGLKGTIGALEVDKSLERDTTNIPIGQIVVDLTRDVVKIDDELGKSNSSRFLKIVISGTCPFRDENHVKTPT